MGTSLSLALTGLASILHDGRGVGWWVRLLECCAACGQLTPATLTTLTGARTPVVWFKICPALLACSAVLLLIASVAPA